VDEEQHRVVRTRVPIRADVWVFGSGYLVAPGRVLTARHVLADQGVEPHVGQPCQVRAWSCGPAETWNEGTVVWLHPRADAAMIAVDGMGGGLRSVPWGRVEGSEPLRWTATGYPLAALDDLDRREEAVYGRLAPGTAASTGGLALTVESRSARPSAAGGSGWAGLSGAAVFSAGRLVGIVTTDPAQWAESLEGIRSSALIDDADLLVCIGAPIELGSVVGEVGVVGPVVVDASAGAASALASDQGGADGHRVVGERVSVGVESWQDRDQLRAELRACLLSGQASKRILSVTGRRGIGKSATVAKVVSEFERPDPSRSPLDDLDALVYLSTRTGVGSVTLAGVFESLTRLLPDPLATRLRAEWDASHAAAFPSLWEALKGRRCVVVLDNLDDVQNPDTGEVLDTDLLTFIESACRTPFPPRLVCTSQRTLGLPPEMLAQVREFAIEDGLDGAHAIALLRSLVSEDVSLEQFSDDELERATQRLGGLPRGIELLAHLLKNDPMALADLLESDTTLDGLMAELVSRAFFGLDEAGRWVVELLALAEVPLPDRELPALLAGVVDPDAARSSLRTLVRGREVGFDAASRRVRLHPLDADWVWRELIKGDPAKQVELDRRLAHWYAARSTPPDSWRALADVTPHRREFDHLWRAGDYPEAMAVLVEAAEFLARKGESAALASAVAAADLIVRDGQARVDLERCRSEIEFFTGSLERAEAALRAALAAAQAAGLKVAIPQLEVDLAAVLRHRSDCGRAIQTLQVALNRPDPSLSHGLRLVALFELGLSFCYLQNWKAAEDAATELEQLLRSEDLRKSHAAPSDIRALSRLGAGDYAGALAAADDAIAEYLDSPNQDNVGYLYNVRGLVGLERGDLDQAATELQNAVDLAAQYRIDRLEGLCATNLAWALMRASRWTEAQVMAQRGVARLTSSGVPEVATAAALERALAAPGVDAQAVEATLTEAVDGSAANSDFYTPTSGVLAALTAALTGRPQP
jgi:tetratricopeptide (TPR) repeat protein